MRRYRDPSRLFFFSLHLFDQDEAARFQFYPGTGRSDDYVHNCINAPLLPIWRAPSQQLLVENMRRNTGPAVKPQSVTLAPSASSAHGSGSVARGESLGMAADALAEEPSAGEEVSTYRVTTHSSKHSVPATLLQQKEWWFFWKSNITLQMQCCLISSADSPCTV